jgi:hypothetical protein
MVTRQAAHTHSSVSTCERIGKGQRGGGVCMYGGGQSVSGGLRRWHTWNIGLVCAASEGQRVCVLGGGVYMQ